METVAVTQEHTFGIVEMFSNADIVVQTVMLGLALASLVSWAIVFEKIHALRQMNRALRAFDDRFWSDLSVDKTYAAIREDKAIGSAAVFRAAMTEWLKKAEDGKQKRSKQGFGSLRERIDRIMAVQIAREAQRLKSRLFILAIIGSAGPFVGLFGTVWGIMNSFKSIAQSGATSLAVVAPGLAEALFATALGLVAAIPSVVFYNILINRAGGVIGAISHFAEELSMIFARRLEDE